jgi:hypothetical protein
MLTPVVHLALKWMDNCKSHDENYMMAAILSMGDPITVSLFCRFRRQSA